MLARGQPLDEPLIPDAPAAPLHPNAAGEQGMADTIVQDIKAAA